MHRIDTTSGLLRAAVAIARHERPDSDANQVEAAISELAAAAARGIRSDSPQAKLAHLHDVLFDVVGFSGNNEDYYNPANSYLPEVLASRRGLPIALVLIYKCVAERLGLQVWGINSPGHFLAAVDCPEPGQRSSVPGRRMYVDPFYGGQLLNRSEVFRRIGEATGQTEPPSGDWLAEASHREWIGRMLNNLQAVFAYSNRQRELFAMQELQAPVNRLE